jgi:wyosine [tRNA(Phe)-imidazoG37] synthetase (radical SAM superfamily)
VINSCFDIFSKNIDYTECLNEYEGNQFDYTGDIEQDILSITSIHPMQEDGVEELLRKAGKDWGIIDKLLNEGKLTKIKYGNSKYYARNLDY